MLLLFLLQKATIALFLEITYTKSEEIFLEAQKRKEWILKTVFTHKEKGCICFLF